MARQADTAISDWAFVEIKDRSGTTFYTLEDLRFEVEFLGGVAQRVLAIETEYTDTRNGRGVKRQARLTDADALVHVIVGSLDITTLEFERHAADAQSAVEDAHYEATRDAAMHGEAL